MDAYDNVNNYAVVAFHYIEPPKKKLYTGWETEYVEDLANRPCKSGDIFNVKKGKNKKEMKIKIFQRFASEDECNNTLFRKKRNAVTEEDNGMGKKAITTSAKNNLVCTKRKRKIPEDSKEMESGKQMPLEIQELNESPGDENQSPISPKIPRYSELQKVIIQHAHVGIAQATYKRYLADSQSKYNTISTRKMEKLKNEYQSSEIAGKSSSSNTTTKHKPHTQYNIPSTSKRTSANGQSASSQTYVEPNTQYQSSSNTSLTNNQTIVVSATPVTSISSAENYVEPNTQYQSSSITSLTNKRTSVVSATPVTSISSSENYIEPNTQYQSSSNTSLTNKQTSVVSATPVTSISSSQTYVEPNTQYQSSSITSLTNKRTSVLSAMPVTSISSSETNTEGSSPDFGVQICTSPQRSPKNIFRRLNVYRNSLNNDDTTLKNNDTIQQKLGEILETLRRQEREIAYLRRDMEVIKKKIGKNDEQKKTQKFKEMLLEPNIDLYLQQNSQSQYPIDITLFTPNSNSNPLSSPVNNYLTHRPIHSNVYNQPYSTNLISNSPSESLRPQIHSTPPTSNQVNHNITQQVTSFQNAFQPSSFPLTPQHSTSSSHITSIKPKKASKKSSNLKNNNSAKGIIPNMPSDDVIKEVLADHFPDTNNIIMKIKQARKKKDCVGRHNFVLKLIPILYSVEEILNTSYEKKSFRPLSQVVLQKVRRLGFLFFPCIADEEEEIWKSMHPKIVDKCCFIRNDPKYKQADMQLDSE